MVKNVKDNFFINSNLLIFFVWKSDIACFKNWYLLIIPLLISLSTERNSLENDQSFNVIVFIKSKILK